MIGPALPERLDLLRPATRLAAAIVLHCCAVLFVLPIPASAQNDLGQAGWLSGCWVAAADDVRSEEIWMEPAGGLMVGMARTVRGGAVTGYEFVLLREVDDRVTFSAQPSGQEPTDFGATEMTSDRMRFENPGHDFPRAIEYERASPDSLIAKVYGEIESSEPAFVLRYARSHC